jgi:N-acetylglucosamine-6-phosphate deacetylase
LDGRITAIRSKAPRGIKGYDCRGAYLAPGFIDVHVWGDPERVSRDAVRAGTTAFLTTLGPDSSRKLLAQLRKLHVEQRLPGAACLGVHLEGPFVNPARGGALRRRWMRRPTPRELRALANVGAGAVKLVTIAPELHGAIAAIRWCARQGIVVSLGHSDARARTAQQAVGAGARAVTHVFNGMRPLHHRETSLLDVALTERRLTTMVILDGVHVSPAAFRLLVRAKGPEHVALVTDSIRRAGWPVVRRQGAFYTKRGMLAGSDLTMMDAVRNAANFAGLSLGDAVQMATAVPAKLLGLSRTRGALEIGKHADLVAFDRQFRVRLTLVAGRVVYERG